MKILPIIYNEQKTNSKLITPQYNRMLVGDNNKSTMTYTSITFSGTGNSLKEAAREILSKPELAASFGAFMAAGFAALKALAGVNGSKNQSDIINNDSESQSLAETYAEAFLNTFTIKSGTEKEKSEQIKEDKETTTNDDNISLVKTEENENTEEEQQTINEFQELVLAEFPKKWGRLSNSQKILKDAVEKLKLTEDKSIMLTQLCKFILEDESGKVNNTDVERFAAELSSASSSALKIGEVIKNYYNYYLLKQQDKTEGNVSIGKTDSDSVAQEDKDGKEIYRASKNLKGPKIVGKINLADATGYVSMNNIDKIKKTSESNEIESMMYKRPGTVKDDVRSELDRMFRHFLKVIIDNNKENRSKDESIPKIKWMRSKSVSNRITGGNVRKEIENQMKKDSKKSYENIINEDYNFIADVINKDPRYSEFFDLHSTLRFFDRYIKFGEDKENIEKQSKQLLDKLFKMILDACEKGIYIQVYDGDGGYKGARIILDAKNFDKEALELFGSESIVIGMSEKSNIRKNKPLAYYDMQALITTVFPTII